MQYIAKYVSTYLGEMSSFGLFVSPALPLFLRKSLRVPRCLRRGSLRVPGMFMNLEGESPSANLMEVKASEAQGHLP